MSLNSVGIHRLKSQMAAVNGDPNNPPSSYIWVSKQGNDDWNGAQENPYLTLAAAIDVMTAARKTVIILPGEYTSAASLAVPVGLTDMLFTGITSNHDSTIIRATGGSEVFLITPDATIGLANVHTDFADLVISAANGINGVQITNTNMDTGKKLLVTFRNCGFDSDDDSTEFSVITTHTDVDSMIKIYMHGTGLGGNNIEAPCYFDLKNAGDRVKCNGMQFEGGVEFTSSGDVAAEIEFNNCIMKLDAGAGGNANYKIRANGCLSRTGLTYAAAAQGEFDAANISNYASKSFT